MDPAQPPRKPVLTGSPGVPSGPINCSCRALDSELAAKAERLLRANGIEALEEIAELTREEAFALGALETDRAVKAFMASDFRAGVFHTGLAALAVAEGAAK